MIARRYRHCENTGAKRIGAAGGGGVGGGRATAGVAAAAAAARGIIRLSLERP